MFSLTFQSKTQATIVLSGIYIFLSMVGNIAATKVTYFGPLIQDAGFIFALTFTWRDLIHKQLGKSAALTTVYLSSLINILSMLYFQLVVNLPAEPEWAAAGGQAAWEFLFTLQFRIVIASAVAQVIAETIDTQVYSAWVKGLGKYKPQWLRVVISNAISIPIDSLIFPIIAFGGILSMPVLFEMFQSNILVKVLFTLATAWLIYLIPTQPLYQTKE